MPEASLYVLPFLISVALTPLVKKYSVICKAYAQENKRTVHHGLISRIGGVAIYLAFMICAAVFVHADRAVFGILAGGSVMFSPGWWMTSLTSNRW